MSTPSVLRVEPGESCARCNREILVRVKKNSRAEASKEKKEKKSSNCSGNGSWHERSVEVSGNPS